jgi:transposase
MASMTYDKVVSAQLVEGTFDQVLFENFLYRTLNSMRLDKNSKDKHIVILMDNAAIHKNSTIYETARKMNASIVLNA